MPTRAPQRAIDRAEIAALRARVRERQLVDPDDYLLIDELLGLTSDLAVALDHKKASLARLRQLVFGSSSDVRSTAATDAAPSHNEATTPMAPAPAASPDCEPALPTRRGHGRRPPSAYTGARREPCANALRPGDPCPECFGRGKLYDTNHPSAIVKMTGRPVVLPIDRAIGGLACHGS